MNTHTQLHADCKLHVHATAHNNVIRRSICNFGTLYIYNKVLYIFLKVSRINKNI